MKRKIIRIDDDKCNGCGLCIPNCPEGALKIINGKARVANEFSCDGLGACIGHCPQGAITIEEREAEAYDERKVMANIVKGGEVTVASHLEHLKEHNETEYLKQAIQFLKEKNMTIPVSSMQKSAHGHPMPHGLGHHGQSGGCPGSRMIDRTAQAAATPSSGPTAPIGSELRQWPVQLKLLNPHAPYFKNADLLIAADCVAFAFGNFHRRFLTNKTLVILCPKLDEGMDDYVEKLSVMLHDNDIKSITVARMEVPCCGGTTALVQEALARSGKNILVKEYVISLNGEII